MAIESAFCNVAKVEALGAGIGLHAGSGETFKVALYTSDAVLGASTPAYTTTEEITGTGYTAGGELVSVSLNPELDGNTAIASFASAVWSSATLAARGALIYRVSDNMAIATLDFGEEKSVTATDFTVSFPTNTADKAIVRIG